MWVEVGTEDRVTPFIKCVTENDPVNALLQEPNSIISSIPTRCIVIQYSLLLSMLYMFQTVSPPIIRSSKTVDTASGICEACLLLPLAVAARKLDLYQMIYVQF
jgi:hypothetical protein